MIVLEGPDGGGKSTLAKDLNGSFNYPVVSSEGPEKYDGEIDERIRRYADLYRHNKRVIFDRHPCVSQMAYALMNSQSTPAASLISAFYLNQPLLIYCRPNPGSKRHTVSGEYDTPEYLKRVDDNYDQLMKWYDEWALHHAHYIYRVGDPVPPVKDLVERWRVE